MSGFLLHKGQYSPASLILYLVDPAESSEGFGVRPAESLLWAGTVKWQANETAQFHWVYSFGNSFRSRNTGEGEEGLLHSQSKKASMKCTFRSVGGNAGGELSLLLWRTGSHSLLPYWKLLKDRSFRSIHCLSTVQDGFICVRLISENMPQKCTAKVRSGHTWNQTTYHGEVAVHLLKSAAENAYSSYTQYSCGSILYTASPPLRGLYSKRQVEMGIPPLLSFLLWLHQEGLLWLSAASLGSAQTLLAPVSWSSKLLG